jgi:hypothetical protein
MWDLSRKDGIVLGRRSGKVKTDTYSYIASAALRRRRRDGQPSPVLYTRR